MGHWTKAAQRMIAEHGWAVLVTVCGIYGSIPREAGTKMLVGPTAIAGTIGGGALEHLVIEQARHMGHAATPQVRQMDIPLGPKMRQCCGGRVELLLERLDGKYLDLMTAIAAAEESDQPSRLVTLLTGDRPRKEIMTAAFFITPEKTDEHFTEPLGDRHTPLYIFGAGHVGRAIICRMAGLPFRIIWVDKRQDIFPESIPDNVDICHTSSSVEIVRQATAGAAYLVMTHSHQIDFAVTAAILARNDAAYCGLIGSETKKNRFLKRFREEEGLSQSQCDQLTCPIGLASLSGKAPEIIAIGTIAQLLQKFD
ncbi:Xanthine and CO dehydrogenases maturation factor, XdhC/CoxF family [hydrothermal vent metagenome]|uniref:Xanthine and CO dehydrogenases maturation factor, XdhC/CoxF family n=1 Tax=hydrothermal vent metagenome TaxID=652676 RepID=A0A3B0S914_9ZZZZ